MEIALAKITCNSSSQALHASTSPGVEMASTMMDTTIAALVLQTVQIASIRPQIAPRVQIRTIFTTLSSVIVPAEIGTIRRRAVLALPTSRIAALQSIQLAYVVPVLIHSNMTHRQMCALVPIIQRGMRRAVNVMIVHLDVILVLAHLSAQGVKQGLFSMKPWVCAVAIQPQ